MAADTRDGHAAADEACVAVERIKPGQFDEDLLGVLPMQGQGWLCLTEFQIPLAEALLAETEPERAARSDGLLGALIEDHRLERGVFAVVAERASREELGGPERVT